VANFNADGTRRVAKVVRRSELAPRTRVKPPIGPRITATSKYAVVTAEISLANRSAKTLGKGMGDLQLVTYADDDSASYASMGEIAVPIYCGDATNTTPVGRLVKLDYLDGRLNVDVDFCGG